MKRVFGVLLVFALLVVGVTMLKSQTPITTDNWTHIGNGPCQPATRPPWYYCFATITEETGQSTLSLYVMVQPDGTFTDGRLIKGALYDAPPAFVATNWTGTFDGSTFAGTFSGVMPDGTPFHGYTTETLGLIKRCAGRYGCRYTLGTVAGNGTATYGQ